jgi:hypothetical protein
MTADVTSYNRARWLPLEQYDAILRAKSVSRYAPNVTTFNIDVDLYSDRLRQGVAEAMAALRVGLRSSEDGSFSAKADAPRPGAKIQWSFSHAQSGTTVATLCNDAFVRIVRELITYLDWMIAAEELTSNLLTIPPTVHTPEGALEFVNQRLDASYVAVSRNAGLKNPMKLSRFPGIAPEAEKAALAYFAIRNCLEHHAGRATKDLTLPFSRLRVIAGGVELSPGDTAPENTGIALHLTHEARTIPSGALVEIREEELEHVALTVQSIIAEEVRRVALS